MCVFWQHFIVNTFFIKQYKHPLSIHFCIYPFESPNRCYGIRWELVNKTPMNNSLPSMYILNIWLIILGMISFLSSLSVGSMAQATVLKMMEGSIRRDLMIFFFYYIAAHLVEFSCQEPSVKMGVWLGYLPSILSSHSEKLRWCAFHFRIVLSLTLKLSISEVLKAVFIIIIIIIIMSGR